MMNETQAWQVLATIADPEIPAVDIVELGIVRDIAIAPEHVTVTITPTFAGCPALHVIRQQIVQTLEHAGASAVEVKTQLFPVWTTDWITDEARAKLKAFGLAPPRKHGGDIEIILHERAVCPRCNSTSTRLQNSFGTTLCRAIYTCNACKETFEQFKAI